MYKVLFAILLSANLLQAADDKDSLLTTEYEYISELLTMGLPSFAQAHLNVIKKEFPEERANIAYYQAHIHFKSTKYSEAVEELHKVLKDKPSEARLKEVRKLLTLAYIRIGKFDEAILHFKRIKPFGGANSWYAETCVELGETQARTFVKKTPAERVELKKKGFTVLNAYQTQFPKNAQAPIILYYLAEFQYDNLVLLLTNFGEAEKEASPEVRAEKSKAIILQLHKARKVYQAIVDNYPKSPIIKRVKPRLTYLAAVVKKMKRNEL